MLVKTWFNGLLTPNHIDVKKRDKLQQGHYGCSMDLVGFSKVFSYVPRVCSTEKKLFLPVIFNLKAAVNPLLVAKSRKHVVCSQGTDQILYGRGICRV